jgi:hypothetical protein
MDNNTMTCSCCNTDDKLSWSFKLPTEPGYYIALGLATWVALVCIDDNGYYYMNGFRVDPNDKETDLDICRFAKITLPGGQRE